MNRRIAGGVWLAVAQAQRRKRPVLRAFSHALCVAVVGLAATAAGAAASGAAGGPPPASTSTPFHQCPAIGLDSSCGYLIDVTSPEPATPTVVRDPGQPFFDGEDDVTIGVQNDSSVSLEKIHLGVPGSGDRLFALDGDGLCATALKGPKPAGCPFQVHDSYAGPDTELQPEAGCNPPSALTTCDAGIVKFPTPLAPGQYTYFSLEAPPPGSLIAGPVNDIISTKLTDARTHESAVALAAPAPTPITDQATVKGVKGAIATGTMEYVLYSDPRCTKVAERLGTKNVSAGVAEPSEASSANLPTNAAYFWVAKYSGDGNNSANSSGCGAETMSFGAPPALSAPGSSGASLATLTVLGLHLNRSNGQITVTALLPSAGLLSADAVVRQGATLARVVSVYAGAAKSKKCKRGFVLRHGRCVNNASVLYGFASRTTATPGTYALVIKPTKRVLEDLRKGKKPLVTVLLTFQPIPSGTQLSAARTLTALVKQPKHHKH
jgi:hypothetical protein